MKKTILLLSLLSFIFCFSQNYTPIINYYFNGTPSNGIKIKTNIPFTNGSQMPTLLIEGYNYGQQKTIGLSIVWYIYSGSFTSYSASSYGAFAPEIKLSNESGKVVIFINARDYYNRFTVRGYANGMGEAQSWFSGWAITDEVLSGTNTVTIPYKNAFAGVVDVNGLIHAKEVKVDLNGWADYVFDKDYKLMSLDEIELYIAEKGHLPNIPNTKEVLEKGIDIADMNAKLLQKIEELTLYSIEQNKMIKLQNKRLSSLEKKIKMLKSK